MGLWTALATPTTCLAQYPPAGSVCLTSPPHTHLGQITLPSPAGGERSGGRSSPSLMPGLPQVPSDAQAEGVSLARVPAQPQQRGGGAGPQHGGAAAHQARSQQHPGPGLLLRGGCCWACAPPWRALRGLGGRGKGRWECSCHSRACAPQWTPRSRGKGSGQGRSPSCNGFEGLWVAPPNLCVLHPPTAILVSEEQAPGTPQCLWLMWASATWPMPGCCDLFVWALG